MELTPAYSCAWCTTEVCPSSFPKDFEKTGDQSWVTDWRAHLANESYQEQTIFTTLACSQIILTVSHIIHFTVSHLFFSRKSFLRWYSLSGWHLSSPFGSASPIRVCHSSTAEVCIAKSPLTGVHWSLIIICQDDVVVCSAHGRVESIYAFFHWGEALLGHPARYLKPSWS